MELIGQNIENDKKHNGKIGFKTKKMVLNAEFSKSKHFPVEVKENTQKAKTCKLCQN